MSFTAADDEESGPSVGGFLMFAGIAAMVVGVLYVVGRFVGANSGTIAEGVTRGLKGGA